MNRREYLYRMAAVGMLPAFSSWMSMDNGLIKRRIPGTRESVTAIGVGTWETFDVDSSRAQDLEPLREVLTLFVGKGGNVIDTSPMYGFAERNVGTLSTEAGINQQLFLATKVWTSGKENGIAQMKESLQLLKRDKIDLMQIHNLVDWKTHIKTLREWKDKGTIRYIGITHYRENAYQEMESIMNSEPIDFIQVNYNIVDRKAADRLLPLAAEKGIGVIISQPFGYGRLFDRVKSKTLPEWAGEFDCRSWAQFFLKYIISHPAVTCAIPGTGVPAHLLDNIQAAYGRLPDEAARERMVKAI
ncbi:MAG TPA: aldo/keto reductase [Cyclobacteriaceae bacterium]